MNVEGHEFGLRACYRRDIADIHRLFCIPKVYEYLADGEAPPPAIASTWVEAAADDGELLGGGLWALTLPATDEIMGIVRLSADDAKELELTYLLHPDVWGRGLATRMAHAVMANAFEQGRVTTIWAGADLPNRASIAVMERLGMVFRRRVEYPAGLGVEYEMPVSRFDRERIEGLPLR